MEEHRLGPLVLRAQIEHGFKLGPGRLGQFLFQAPECQLHLFVGIIRGCTGKQMAIGIVEGVKNPFHVPPCELLHANFVFEVVTGSIFNDVALKNVPIG